MSWWNNSPGHARAAKGLRSGSILRRPVFRQARYQDNNKPDIGVTMNPYNNDEVEPEPSIQSEPEPQPQVQGVPSTQQEMKNLHVKYDQGQVKRVDINFKK